MRQVIPWSYSSYNAYETCPYRFYKTKVLKEYVEAESEQIIWGNTVHKSIEHNLKDGIAVPATVERFMPLVHKINAAAGDTYVELELACTVDLRPTGFWADDVWCRGKGDLVKVNVDTNKALNIDWKTGKVKPNSAQLELMAVMTFATFPEIEQVSTVFVWFQQPANPTIRTYQRSEVPRLIGHFTETVKQMEWSEKHGTWPKKPSGLCRQWCPVKDCPYWGKGGRR